MPIVWTEADKTKLMEAIASGVLTVKYSGPPAREVTYQSLDAMRTALASISANVDAQSGVVTGHSVAKTSKGFDS